MPPLALTATMSSNSGSVSRVTRTPARSSRASRRGEGRGDGLVEPVERQPLGDAEAQAGERDRLERRKLLAGHDGVGLGAIGDAARDRPDRIERIAQRESAVGRNALPARLEADEAAQRRRNAHRAAGVGADRDLAHAVGDRDRRARRGAAGHARAVARIARRAEMRIGADAGKGELGHIGLGDDHRAGGAQPPHDRRIGDGRRRFLGEDFRAGAGRLAGDVEQILDADDGAVERAERHAARGARIGRIGRGARASA